MTVDINCAKCDKFLSTAWFDEKQMDLIDLRSYYKDRLCSDCERIKAWLPEIVQAVIEAMKEKQ